jgi:sRNA-binding regulator protein Hfq
LEKNKGRKLPPKSRPPDQTFEEVHYLRYLIDQKVPVSVKLMDNEIVSGLIEYYDHSFIRLTRPNAPNLFIFKHDIKYVLEEPK